MNDPRLIFAHALDQAGTLVSAVPSALLGEPAPCDDFRVRDLLGHLDALLRRVAHVIDGGHPFDVPHVIEADADDWSDVWAADRAELDAKLADDAVLDRTLVLPFGELPGRTAIGAYIGEVTTHSWDLTTSIGRPDLLDEELAVGCRPTVQKFIRAEPRGGPARSGPWSRWGTTSRPTSDSPAGWGGTRPGITVCAAGVEPSMLVLPHQRR